MNFNSRLFKKLNAAISAVITLSLIGFYVQNPLVAQATDGSICADGQTSITRVSNGSIGTVVVASYPGSAWTTIPGASWIWSEDPITSNPAAVAFASFNDSFTVSGTVTSASLEIASDNSATISLNGTSVGSSNDFHASQVISIPTSAFVSGTNNLSFGVTNDAVEGADPETPNTNPAGVIYKLSVCVTPTPVVPGTGGTDTNGATSGSSASTTIPVPPTGGTGTNGAISGANASTTITVPPTGGTDTNGATSTPTTTPATPEIIQPNTSGGSSGGGSGSVRTLASTTLGTIGLSCPFMKDFVYVGYSNKSDEIRKLQTFLRAYEGNTKITVNGILDAATIAGVKAFQAKYLTQTMGPWGATIPSGNVYITTLKQINYIVCNTRPAFTPAELAIIEAYKAGQTNGGTNSVSNGGQGEVIASTPAPATSTTETTPKAEQKTTDNTNLTGAAGQSGLLQSLWNFITGLFK